MKTPDTKDMIPEINIKWRQHEIILVTAIATIGLAGRLWFVYHSSPDLFEGPFLDTKTAFDLNKNVLFPDISVGLSAYLTYLWFSLYTIPRLLFQETVGAGTLKTTLLFSKSPVQGVAKKMTKEYAWIFIQIILVIFILGCILNIATYYRHQWLFNYEGFSIFFDKNNPKSQMDIGGTFFAAGSIVFIYGLYVCAREFVIYFIQKSRQRQYNTLICNKVTSFILQFVCAGVFLDAFNIVNDRQFFVSYSLYLPALFAMYISNVYWLFPMKGDAPFFSKKIIVRLLSTSFIYSIPLSLFIHEQGPVALMYSWAEQLFIVTPLTWWYFQTNKDKILQLRNVEKELVKSKADLQFLRSQINPHFLFNVLNTLYGTALQENAELTAGGIQKLGDMMRFMLHENNLDFIQMNKEIEYLKNYIDLQKLRTQFSPEIIIEDNISDQSCNHKIAPMLLIPLVENAFKHGISLKERSWIKIILHCTEANIRFEVRNSIHAKKGDDPEKDKSGIGFNNVAERLKLFYPGRFQLTAKEDGGEYLVQLTIQPG